MPEYRTPLLPGKIYHIYNHGNGDDNLFRSEENYRYFLKKFSFYIDDIAETHAYCLMPNRFHFLIQVKSENELIKILDPGGFKNIRDQDIISKRLAQIFSNFFNSYAKAYNKQYKRIGSLFRNKFHKKEVKTSDYYANLIHYIHFNPVHHGFCKSPSDWLFSSYQVFMSNKKSIVKKMEVLDWFGGKEAFISFHQKSIPTNISYKPESY